MGGRPLWQCGASPMVPQNTRNGVIETPAPLDEFLKNLVMNQLVKNITGTASGGVSLKLGTGG